MDLLLPFGSTLWYAKPNRFASFQGRNSPIVGGKIRCRVCMVVLINDDHRLSQKKKRHFCFILPSVRLWPLLDKKKFSRLKLKHASTEGTDSLIFFSFSFFCQDSANSSGGKWIIRFKKAISGRFWEDLVMDSLLLFNVFHFFCYIGMTPEDVSYLSVIFVRILWHLSILRISKFSYCQPNLDLPSVIHFRGFVPFLCSPNWIF